MKHRVPQFDFALPDEPFKLAQETTLDGERLVREKAQREADRKASEAMQRELEANP